jgi:hypothetical protein
VRTLCVYGELIDLSVTSADWPSTNTGGLNYPDSEGLRKTVMKRVLWVAIVGLIGAAVVAGYQIGSVYLANIELQSDLKDLSSLTGTRIGLVDPRSTDQIREQVIEHAAQYGIHLGPEQVNVERDGEGKDGTISLSAAYDTNMNVFGLRWTIHFTAASPRS